MKQWNWNCASVTCGGVLGLGGDGLMKIQKEMFSPRIYKVNLEVTNCNFHRYDYLEFTDARGAKTRYDTKVGTEKWPKVSTFKILNQMIDQIFGNLVIPMEKLLSKIMSAWVISPNQGWGKKFCNDASKGANK